MKFLLDENEDPAILPPVRAALGKHDFLSAAEAGLRHIKDVQLFEKLAENGYSGSITRDRNQLKFISTPHFPSSSYSWVPDLFGFVVPLAAPR